MGEWMVWFGYWFLKKKPCFIRRIFWGCWKCLLNCICKEVLCSIHFSQVTSEFEYFFQRLYMFDRKLWCQFIRRYNNIFSIPQFTHIVYRLSKLNCFAKLYIHMSLSELILIRGFIVYVVYYILYSLGVELG